MRKVEFILEEYYHIFNRGVDKRKIFMTKEDFERFFQSMEEFNTLEPIGSIYENFFRKKEFGGSASKHRPNKKKLVNFICYCLNPNHYHFILEPLTKKGIENFMHRLGTGYTMYFNEKYKRSGSLFQGKYKATYVNSENLLYVSTYVNLNNRVHQLGGSASKSSFNEYVSDNSDKINETQKAAFCEKSLILEQFNNKSEYKNFAFETLKVIQEGKQEEKEMKKLLLE